MPSSPRSHTGDAIAGDRALPARQPPDTSQHCRTNRKHPSPQPASAARSESHHRSLAFAVPAFPMPEQHGSGAMPSAGVPTAAAALSKPRPTSLHDRAGPTRPRGGAEQQALPKVATRNKGGKSAAPTRAVLAAGHGSAADLTSTSAAEAGHYHFAEKLHLRSSTGQSLARAMDWEACSSASKPAAVPC